MPKKTEYPKLRTHTKTGSDGRVWVSYFYDMRGTGEKDVSLGTDRDAALRLWAQIREAAASGVCRPKPRRRIRAQPPSRPPTAARPSKRRSFEHAVWSAAPPWAKPMYIASEKRSREAGRLTFLTANEFLAVVTRAAGACELTCIPFDTASSRNGRRRPFAPSMDRIDCSKGYIAGNVRLVALIVNCALGDFGEEAFEVAATAFLKARAGAALPRAGADTRERFSDTA